MGLRRNPARCLFDPYARSPLGNDALRKTGGKRQASSAPNLCADCATSCNSDAFPTGFGTRASAPLSAASSPTSSSSMLILASEAGSGGPAHVDGAQRVKRESKRFAMHHCDHRSGEERRCGDGDLEVVEMCASWGRATARVRVLRVRVPV